MNKALRYIVPSFFIIISILVFRLAFDFSDWSALLLCPLVIVVYMGNYSLVLAPWKAKFHLVVRDESWLSKWLTGRLGAGLKSATLAIVMFLFIIWQSVSATIVELVLISILFIITSVTYIKVVQSSPKHFYEPFDRSVSSSFSIWMVTIPAVIILLIYTWSIKTLPSEILDEDFQQVIRLAAQKSPGDKGWISSIISFFYLFDSVKLWAVVQLQDYPLLTLIYSLDTALFGYVLCKTAVIVTNFVITYVIKEDK